MNELTIGLITGLVIGASITGIIFWKVMPSLMI